MVFDIATSMQTIKGHLMASGLFDTVMIGEPKSPPGSGLTASIFMGRAGIEELTLDKTVELHEVVVRFYTPELQQPTPIREDRLEKAVGSIEKAWFGDFTFGGTIRNIDIADLVWEFGEITIGRTEKYRTVEVTLPLIVDGSATLAA